MICDFSAPEDTVVFAVGPTGSRRRALELKTKASVVKGAQVGAQVDPSRRNLSLSGHLAPRPIKVRLFAEIQNVEEREGRARGPEPDE